MKSPSFYYLFFFLTSFNSMGQVNLIFRYDDFLLQSDPFNKELVTMFSKHEIPLVLGVIPSDSEEQLILEENYTFLPELKAGINRNLIEIALHGLNHVNLRNGEFGGLPFKEQSRRILKGQTYLESIFDDSIVTFIPPWNAYDTNTLLALEKNGMNNISSALTINQPCNNSAINYYPCTIEHPNLLLSMIKKNKNREAIIVLMFHRYDFSESFTLLDLEKILKAIKKMRNVKCSTFRKLRYSNVIVDGKRFAANLEINLLSKKLHLGGAMQSHNFITSIRILNVFAYLAFTFAVYLFIANIRFLGTENIYFSNKTIPVILFFFVVYAVWFHIASPLRLIILCALLPASLKLIGFVCNEILKRQRF